MVTLLLVRLGLLVLLLLLGLLLLGDGCWESAVMGCAMTTYGSRRYASQERPHTVVSLQEHQLTASSLSCSSAQCM